MAGERSGGLIAWQWGLYPDGHKDRGNLLIHILTVPLFLGGTLALIASPLFSGWLALGGAGAMVVAVAAQGRGHKREATAPVPFRGPMDVVARLFVEQWLTFPRFVFSGRFGAAWRRTNRTS